MGGIVTTPTPVESIESAESSDRVFIFDPEHFQSITNELEEYRRKNIQNSQALHSILKSREDLDGVVIFSEHTGESYIFTLKFVKPVKCVGQHSSPIIVDAIAVSYATQSIGKFTTPTIIEIALLSENCVVSVPDLEYVKIRRFNSVNKAVEEILHISQYVQTEWSNERV